MSATKIQLNRYLCRCDHKDCPGHGQSWLSKDENVPERCTFCGRRTWNGNDKRLNRFLTINGTTKRLSEWAKESGVSKQLISHRIHTGWSEHDAVWTPASPRKEHSAVNQRDC